MHSVELAALRPAAACSSRTLQLRLLPDPLLTLPLTSHTLPPLGLRAVLGYQDWLVLAPTAAATGCYHCRRARSVQRRMSLARRTAPANTSVRLAVPGWWLPLVPLLLHGCYLHVHSLLAAFRSVAPLQMLPVMCYNPPSLLPPRYDASLPPPSTTYCCRLLALCRQGEDVHMQRRAGMRLLINASWCLRQGRLMLSALCVRGMLPSVPPDLLPSLLLPTCTCSARHPSCLLFSSEQPCWAAGAPRQEQQLADAPPLVPQRPSPPLFFRAPLVMLPDATAG